MSGGSSVSYVRSDDLLDEPAPTANAPRRGLGRRRHLAGAALALLGLPLLTLLLDGIQSALSLEGEVLLYLLTVVIVAVVGGVVVALVAAVAAALLINYFFVAPVHTLDIAHADQAVALGVFLVVAGVVSGAVELASRRARAAEQAAAQAEILSALAGSELDEHETLRDLLERARQTFNMQTVALKVKERGVDGWTDVEQVGWSPKNGEAPLRFDVPIGELRLIGRGAALFAEDQRVLGAFAAAAQTAFSGRQLTRKARAATTLAAVDRQRTALLAAVGHDLRTPLASIKASVSSLRQSDIEWSARDRKQFLATIEESADRLDSVVANLLDASRLQAGAFSVQAHPVALDEVVNAAVLAVADAEGKVNVHVPENLPLVMADPGLLERVFVNLIDNAVRYGGADAPIEVVASAGAENAKVEVIDNGPGIPSEQRERLFEPFQRLNDSSTRSGVGLGLSVARGFTEAMGGALVADKGPRGGLRMRMRLPLARPATDETAEA